MSAYIEIREIISCQINDLLSGRDASIYILTFNPNAHTLSACLQRVAAIQKDLKLDKNKIFTSLDAGDLHIHKEASITNIPTGFSKVILPFNTDGPATFYISAGAPNTTVSEHSHDEGDGIRYIVSGSIIYNGKELKQNDWMFLPAKSRYSFKVGARGVIILYCYQCCCA